MNLFDKTDLMKTLKAIKALNENDIFIEVMNNDEVQKFIVKLNTDQMRLDFINSDGVKLSDIGGAYSPFTVQKGRKKGPDSVDLYDTGEFHESFRITNISGAGFDIVSDPIKSDGTNLLTEWGEKVEGLTEESLTKTAEKLVEFYVSLILKRIAA